MICPECNSEVAHKPDCVTGNLDMWRVFKSGGFDGSDLLSALRAGIEAGEIPESDLVNVLRARGFLVIGRDEAEPVLARIMAEFSETVGDAVDAAAAILDALARHKQVADVKIHNTCVLTETAPALWYGPSEISDEDARAWLSTPTEPTDEMVEALCEVYERAYSGWSGPYESDEDDRRAMRATLAAAARHTEAEVEG